MKLWMAALLVACVAPDVEPEPEPEASTEDTELDAPAVADEDGDGVADEDDLCPGADDGLDADGDGVPDGCATLAECGVHGLIGTEVTETLWCSDTEAWFVGDVWKVTVAGPACISISLDRLTVGGGDPWVVVQGPSGGSGGLEGSGPLDDGMPCTSSAAWGTCPEGAVRTFAGGEVWILTGLKSGTCIAGQTRVALKVSVDGQPATPERIRDDVELCDPLGPEAFLDPDGDGVLGSCDQCEGDDAAGDLDEDGLCGEADDDDDGDGVLDAEDECLGDDAIGDFDGDGLCDDVDLDDDGDWVPDDQDLCLGWWWWDTDGDGLCDDVDDDDDGDGVPDTRDLCLGDDALGDPDGDGVCG